MPPPRGLAELRAQLFPTEVAKPCASHPPPSFQQTGTVSPRQSKRQRLVNNETEDKLGMYISRDMSLARKLGVVPLLQQRTSVTDWGPLHHTQDHRAHRHLRQYRASGIPVTLADRLWTAQERQLALDRGPHRSAYEYMDFLREDMADMVEHGHWMVLPYDVVAHLPNLRLSPIGVVPQRARRPRPIVDYTFYGVNDATQPNARMDSMQFGNALDRLIRRVLLANPRYGKVYAIKVDLSDGF